MIQVTGEGGERFCSIDMYGILGDIARDWRRTVLGLSEGDSLKGDPFWGEYRILETEFEKLFHGYFSDWNDWSSCFNTEDGVSLWWQSFKGTSNNLQADAIIARMRVLLLKYGLTPDELSEKNLLQKSFELDQAWANIWLPPERQSVVLKRPYGWLELRLIGLTLPPGLGEVDTPDPNDLDAE